ncbi:MAG: phosphate signaling complex protein PhoU [Phycisphaerae bacterium]
MSELQQRLDQLVLRLDRMGMRVEQAVIDALAAVANGDIQAGTAVDENDSVVDREEVQIEQECVRLLALYQPAAVDLRTICTIIKVNSDLERIADLAAGIGRRVKHVIKDDLDLREDAGFRRLRESTLDLLGRTVRTLTATDATSARAVITGDKEIDNAYGAYVRAVLDAEDRRAGGAEPAMTQINLAKALERIGDLCTNIAEDVIFLRTGDIIRHADAFDTSE